MAEECMKAARLAQRMAVFERLKKEKATAKAHEDELRANDK